MSQPHEPLLCVRQLRVEARARVILSDVSFDVDPRQILAIVGPSGAGKSTLLRAINRLAEQTGLRVQGTVTYRGREIRDYPVEQLRTRIGMLFQKPCVYPGSILRNVLFGVRHHRRLDPRQRLALAEDVLRKAHLWAEVKDRFPQRAAELSVGQQQRLCFARVLAVDPEILLLDEPTSSLDPHSTREIERTLCELRHSKSILLVTHAEEQASRLADQMLRLSVADGVGRVVSVIEAPVPA